MITHKYVRSADGREQTNETTEVSDLRSLMANTIYTEFEYGADVLKLEPTEISLQTKIFATYDVNTFTGTAEELKLLFDYTSFYAVIKAVAFDDEATISKLAMGLHSLTGGLPLGVVGLAGAYLGNKFSIGAMIAYLELVMKFPREVLNITQLDKKDRIELFLMAIFEEATLEDLIVLAA